MLRKRIIPFLLIDKNGDCIKTVSFSDRQYVGDILNNIRIFNEKEADEIVVLDIDITKKKYEPNFEIISKIASVCRMPLTYGGGVKDVNTAKKIINLGVEKICLNSSVLSNINLVEEMAKELGSQSVSVCLNFKKINNNYFIVSNTGYETKLNFLDYLKKLQDNGVGEIIFNSYNDEGTMRGYDFDFLEKVNKYLKVPSIILGGCSDYENIKKLFKLFPNFASGCSSIFIYKGKLKAVLRKYP